jgi:hypothetical protein
LTTRYEWERTSAALVPMLAEVGIKLNVVLLSYQAMVTRLWTDGDFDLALIGYTCLADPSIGVERIFATSSITGAPWTNVNYYSNPEVDQLFEQARIEVNQTLRAEYFKHIQQILHEEEPEALICMRSPIFAWDNNFGGFPTGPLHCSDRWDSVWWKDGHVYSPWDCQDAISDAESAIDSLEDEGYDVSRAEEKIAEARDALEDNDYTTAKTAADLAPSLAIAPGGEPGEPGEPGETGDGLLGALPYIALIVVVVIIGVVATAIVVRRKPK